MYSKSESFCAKKTVSGVHDETYQRVRVCVCVHQAFVIHMEPCIIAPHWSICNC